MEKAMYRKTGYLHIIIIFCLELLVAIPAGAYTLRGVVVDAATGEPVDFAGVSLRARVPQSVSPTGVRGQVSADYAVASLGTSFVVDGMPVNTDATFAIVDATVRAMADPANINAADLEAVKSQMLKNIPDNRRDNGYWIVLMQAADQFGQDLNSDFEKTINAMTPETVAAFARRYLVPASRMTLRMAPAEKCK